MGRPRQQSIANDESEPTSDSSLEGRGVGASQIESLGRSFHSGMPRIHLPIAEPCHEDWDAMDRVERGRFCRSCDKQVYDLSSMTEHEAREVLSDHAGGNLCVRYCHDGAGNIRFRPARPVRAAVLALAMAACTPHERASEEQPRQPVPEEHEVEVMGGIEELIEEMGDVPAPELEEGEVKERPRPIMGKPAMPTVKRMGKLAADESSG
jgi:hypothetical protein